MHQILVLSYDARVTANFSKGKKAKDLATICEGYGFQSSVNTGEQANELTAKNND